MERKEKIKELIDEGETFLNKNLTDSDENFISWNNDLKRFFKRTYGDDSDEYKIFNKKLYYPLYFYGEMSKSDYVKYFESNLKVTLNDLNKFSNRSL